MRCTARRKAFISGVYWVYTLCACVTSRRCDLKKVWPQEGVTSRRCDLKVWPQEGVTLKTLGQRAKFDDMTSCCCWWRHPNVKSHHFISQYVWLLHGIFLPALTYCVTVFSPQHFMTVLSRPLVYSTYHPITWTPIYLDWLVSVVFSSCMTP